jgi:hypothetical protein
MGVAHGIVIVAVVLGVVAGGALFGFVTGA